MSAHSRKSVARHPDPTTFKRDQFQVSHVTFEVINHPENGSTFALIAGEAFHKKDRKPLFSAHISAGMAAELRALADVIEPLEPKAEGDQ